MEKLVLLIEVEVVATDEKKIIRNVWMFPIRLRECIIPIVDRNLMHFKQGVKGRIIVLSFGGMDFSHFNNYYSN